MADSQQQALSIYETICTSSADRPFAFHGREQMFRELAAWRETNAGLSALRQAPPEVQSAFLAHSAEWLKAESRDQSNFRVMSTLIDATLHALKESPKPLPGELVRKLLSELRQDAVTRSSFPFDHFLSLLSRDEVTEEIRAELRLLYLQYAPSATGKIDERTLATRNRIAELMHVEGERQLDRGRGPWTQVVFDEIAAMEEITRSGWLGLLEHCRALEQAVPSAKYKKRLEELTSALGEAEVYTKLQCWLGLGPTPGQPPQATLPIEDSAYQKGAVWCLALSHRPEMAATLGDFAIACLRKIPLLGAVSQKVGFACVQALGVMECNEAVGQLTRLRAKIKYSVALRLIEKSLEQAAERSGLTADELEDFAVPAYALDSHGRAEITVGDAKAILQLSDSGEVLVIWQNADGKLAKSVPSHIKKTFAKEVKAVSVLARELEQAYLAQRYRLESSFVRPRTVSLAHWRQYFIAHPLMGVLARGLIWIFSDDGGGEHSGIYSGGEVRDSCGDIVDIVRAAKIRLWHPLSSEASEIQHWRDRVFAAGIRQPFRQAFREVYGVTDQERQSKTYSNRFAGILMRQHQFSNLCRARGWSYRLMGAGFDGFNVPTKILAAWNMHAEFYVDLPSDRKPSLRESALGEQSGFGINLFLASDQVRFYRDGREIAVDEVPGIVYSEVMRDVDLFTSVSGIGEDESWADQGDRGTGLLTSSNTNEFSAMITLRSEILARVLPLTPVADRCQVERAWVEIRGQLGTYRVLIAWGGVLRLTDSGVRRLKIPQNLLQDVAL
ncbi:MAG: DUF4132 domain-containing protein, partial [Acidobacteria bacterium]|nr:DUF4132 domain-containing protein [Acidobacteriota bacterium]